MLQREWTKSSYSQGGMDNCVAARSALGDGVDVCDSQNPELGHLTFDTVEWGAFVSEVEQL
ncbi:DUF397 domain-containing protein [Streptomonospora sp. PA3]|uniref:DUF397 domain-containing protein n=1 Tax=Streptomonospora sp. PA3 TaxID=2607326 RepID=UPI0012DD3C48|nr:DUF397 domain-containing protein [Streptomonospora sp. PA3]MUL40940.1 DUF397 domain-containing protein [Streptomonospora sp. PA3]